MKKVVVTIIISILSVCSMGGFKIVNNQSKGSLLSNSQEIQDETITDKNLTADEIVIPLGDEKNKTSTDEETPSSEVEQNNPQSDRVTVPEKTETKEIISRTTTSKDSSNYKSNTPSDTASKQTTSSSSGNSSTSNKDVSTSSNNKPSTTPSTPKTTTPTETKKTPVYCHEGGKKHLGGDGQYEHGYYNTWQQAWDALTVYMENMSSGNYYIDQCMGCNKYYYYCKPD